MTLDVFVEGCEDSFECKYGGFTLFRCQIFKGWNQELGKLYEQKYGFIWDIKKSIGVAGFFCIQSGFYKNIDKRMDQILEEYDRPYNEGMKIFANHSDCDGEITSDECVLLLKSFGRVDPDKFDKDEDYDDWYLESFDIWKKMMAYAIENDQSILFG